jgi:hypothetical protein
VFWWSDGLALARVESGAYAASHRHLAMLIAELRPGLDAHYLADALLAPWAPSCSSTSAAQ